MGYRVSSRKSMVMVRISENVGDKSNRKALAVTAR